MKLIIRSKNIHKQENVISGSLHRLGKPENPGENNKYSADRLSF